MNRNKTITFSAQGTVRANDPEINIPTTNTSFDSDPEESDPEESDPEEEEEPGDRSGTVSG